MKNFNQQSAISNQQSAISNLLRAIKQNFYLLFMLSSIYFSSSLFAQQQTTATDTWLKQGNDVLKKETSGNVGIGTMQPKEKLHVAGDVRIDGLQGTGNRIVIVDKDGKLLSGRDSEGNPGGGNIIRLPGNAACAGQNATQNAWFESPDFFNKLYLCDNYKFVGIGTSTPYKKLTVNGDVSLANYNTNTTGSENFGDGMSGLEILGMNQIPTRRGISLDPDPSGSFNFFINSNQNPAGFNFKNGASSPPSLLMTINANGNVGIGTNNPLYKLEVIGDVKFDGGLCLKSILCNRPEPLYIGNKDNPNLYMYIGVNKDFNNDGIGDGKVDLGVYETGVGFKDIILQPIAGVAGKVGIGTTEPQYKLDVNGDIRASGKIISNSSLGADFSGDISTTGYLKSGNSIYIDGGTLTGGNLDNTIYSDNANGVLLIGKGTPTAHTDFSGIKVGIGTIDVPQHTLDVWGSLWADEAIFNFVETKSLSVIDLTTLKDLEVTNQANLKALNVDGQTTFNGNLEVDGISTLKKNLQVDGITELNDLHAGTTTLGYTEIHGGLYVEDGVAEDVEIHDGLTVGGKTQLEQLSVNGISDFQSKIEMFKGLYVEGESVFADPIRCSNTINAYKVIVCNQGGCDFVFNEEYNLMPLGELEKFINENKHLPDIEPAQKMVENGVDVAEFQMKLLLKIEELTLHIIELKKTNDQKDKDISNLVKRIGNLELLNQKK